MSVDGIPTMGILDASGKLKEGLLARAGDQFLDHVARMQPRFIGRGDSLRSIRTAIVGSRGPFRPAHAPALRGLLLSEDLYQAASYPKSYRLLSPSLPRIEPINIRVQRHGSLYFAG